MEIDESAKDFVKKLMDKNVETRLSAVEALQHPWLQQKVRKQYNEKLAQKSI
jgi:serine/threonine protein kinase